MTGNGTQKGWHRDRIVNGLNVPAKVIAKCETEER